MYCAAQGEGILTFKCDTVPDAAVRVNVAVLGASAVVPELPAAEGGSF